MSALGDAEQPRGLTEGRVVAAGLLRGGGLPVLRLDEAASVDIGHSCYFLAGLSAGLHMEVRRPAQPKSSSTSFAKPMSRPATIATMTTTKTMTTAV